MLFLGRGLLALAARVNVLVLPKPNRTSRAELCKPYRAITTERWTRSLPGSVAKRAAMGDITEISRSSISRERIGLVNALKYRLLTQANQVEIMDVLVVLVDSVVALDRMYAVCTVNCIPSSTTYSGYHSDRAY